MTYQLTKHTEPNCFVHLVQKAFVESERVKKKKKSWEGLKEEKKMQMKGVFLMLDRMWNSSFKSNSRPAGLPNNKPKPSFKCLGLCGKSSNCCCTWNHILYSAKEPVNTRSIELCIYITLFHCESEWTPQSSIDVIQPHFSPLSDTFIYRVWVHSESLPKLWGLSSITSHWNLQ